MLLSTKTSWLKVCLKVELITMLIYFSKNKYCFEFMNVSEVLFKKNLRDFVSFFQLNRNKHSFPYRQFLTKWTNANFSISASGACPVSQNTRLFLTTASESLCEPRGSNFNLLRNASSSKPFSCKFIQEIILNPQLISFSRELLILVNKFDLFQPYAEQLN